MRRPRRVLVALLAGAAVLAALPALLDWMDGGASSGARIQAILALGLAGLAWGVARTPTA